MTMRVATRRALLYSAATDSPGTTNLIAWWPLGEASGTRVDSHGSNDLTDTNSVLQATGKVGNAADFSAAVGAPEYLDIADNASISVGGTDFTIACWVYFNSKSAVANWIVNKRDSPTPLEYQLTYSTGPSTLRFSWWDNSTTTYAVDGGDVNLSQWYFVIAWYDGTANKIYIQVDNGTPAETATSGTCDDTAANMRIGSSAWTDIDETFSHDGRIDEVALYKRVLTSAERTWLYNSGGGRTYTDL